MSPVSLKCQGECQGLFFQLLYIVSLQYISFSCFTIFTYSSSGNVAVVFFSSVRRELIAPRVDGIILFCGANILFLTTSDTQLYGIIFVGKGNIAAEVYSASLWL